VYKVVTQRASRPKRAALAAAKALPKTQLVVIGDGGLVSTRVLCPVFGGVYTVHSNSNACRRDCAGQVSARLLTSHLIEWEKVRNIRSEDYWRNRRSSAHSI